MDATTAISVKLFEIQRLLQAMAGLQLQLDTDDEIVAKLQEARERLLRMKGATNASH